MDENQVQFENENRCRTFNLLSMLLCLNILINQSTNRFRAFPFARDSSLGKERVRPVSDMELTYETKVADRCVVVNGDGGMIGRGVSPGEADT